MSNEAMNIDLTKIQLCEEKALPLSRMLDAAERAVAENPENAPSGAVDVMRLVGVDSTTLETFGAVVTGKKWKNGRVLRVLHLDGDPAIHAKVEHYAKQWEAYANITFSFVQNGEADIRINYPLDNRSWSYIGTDALSFDQSEETMHYGWLLPATPDDEVRRVVLHEFGHALGMIHEHQHPGAPIDWNKPVVYRYYMERLGWSKAAVDNNLFAHYSKEETQFDVYDPQSIMHYPVSPEFTNNHIEVGWNRDLTDIDKRFIARVYPKAVANEGFPPPGSAPLPTGGAIAGGARLQAKWGGDEPLGT